MFVHRYSINGRFTLNSSLYLQQCGLEDCQPGHSFGPVARDHYLLHFIFGGKGMLRVGSASYELGAGQGFLIAPGILTTYTADNDAPWTYYWMGFNGEDSIRALSQRSLYIESPVFEFDTDSGLEICLKDLIHFYGLQGNNFMALARMFEVFSYINPAIGTKSPKDDKDDLVNQMIQYLEENFSTATVERVAQKFNITRSQVFRLFKAAVGLAPQQYLLQFKINRAASLLRTTNLSVEQICTESGFGNLCNFSRQFKAAYSYSPLQYRNRCKRNSAYWDLPNSPEDTSRGD